MPVAILFGVATGGGVLGFMLLAIGFSEDEKAFKVIGGLMAALAFVALVWLVAGCLGSAPYVDAGTVEVVMAVDQNGVPVPVAVVSVDGKERLVNLADETGQSFKAGERVSLVVTTATTRGVYFQDMKRFKFERAASTPTNR